MTPKQKAARMVTLNGSRLSIGLVERELKRPDINEKQKAFWTKVLVILKAGLR